MEAFLRSVQSRLSGDICEGPVHAILGGPEADVDTVAATLCLALHLNQRKSSDAVCLPVLWLWRSELPEETVRFLHKAQVDEGLLLWRDHVDLLQIQHTGGLSITLLREGLLDSSECRSLKSSVQRVVLGRGQREEGDDMLTTVIREILQEASEQIGAALGQALGEALQMQREALWLKHGRRSEQLDELLSYLEQVSQKQTKRQDWEQLLTKDAKEFSDGEMTIVLTSVTADKEERPMLAERLKSFCQRHGYDSVVVLLSITDPVCHSRQQVALYANNTDIINQISCELEESSSWSLCGELDAKENFQVYHIPVNTTFPGPPPVLEEEIQSLLKDFVDRRSSVLACHPSSRTSSTEGVAGSIDFSQGSSGITDMDECDMDRTDTGSGDVTTGVRALGDGEEDTSAGGAVELVSPDSGMTTIRSSRSSKESSVFLSDDSPIADILAGGGTSAPGQFLRNPSPLGLLSLSPPVPPERRRNRSNRNRTDNVDLFSFDPLHNSGNTNPEDATGRPSSSEMEELSLVDFSAPTSVSEFDSRNSSIDFHIQTVVPPTPVNSLVGSRPPSSCGVRFFPEDVIERINGLQHKDSVSSSLSETWDEFSFDTQGAMSSSDNSSWNVAKTCESPQNVLEVIKNQESNNELKEDTSKTKTLEPQLSLIMEQTEAHDGWKTDHVINDQWNPVTLADLQLTPPEEEVVVKRKTEIVVAKDKKSKKKELLSTLTPDTSREEEDDTKKSGKHQMELLDFWTYSAQKGFLKSDSGTTTSYPESLDMWNMTIRDDSLSPLNTPNCLSENSPGNASEESPQSVDKFMVMWNTTIREDSSSTIASAEGKDLSQTGSIDVSPQTPESKNLEAETLISGEANVKIVIEAAEQVEDQDTWDQSESIQDGANQISDPWELPAHELATSTSEYDNIGGATWSLSSSPDSSLLADLIQLEAQSSPFMAVTQSASEENTKRSDDFANQELSSDQVFTFEDDVGKKDGETLQKQSDDHSPFMLVEVNQRTQMEQSVSANLFNWDDLISKTQQASVKSAKEERTQGFAMEGESKMSETLSSGSVGERDGLKYSPDSLHPGSRDELRSSDGDSSSGLEMESIIVSGTVKETERERPVPKEAKKSMETFSMLSYAATILQTQSAQKRKETTNLDQSQSNTSVIPKIISPSQSESLQKSESITSQDDKSVIPPRSTSPSLRYPSDYFLKTREEVYVHSQISMEDSDEGGQSPSAMPPSSLGDIQAWSEQLERQDTQGTSEAHTPGTSEAQSSPVTNSSVSHSSSFTGSPLSETAPPPERGLALPFSGDLMEEENEEEELEEETKEHTALPTQYDEEGGEQLMGHTQLRHQEVTSQPLFQPMGGDGAYQWTGSEEVSQVHTQYGYNYHHIDQRTEHHSGLATCMSPKPSGQQPTGEVYAEFTCEPEYYKQRDSAAYSSGEYLGQSTYEGDSYHQTEGQAQYQSEHAQYGPDEQFYTSPDQTARGDHARYVSDGYVHFLLSRQQGDSTDMGSREDPEEMENREDPPSSTDVSVGSGQRRKLSAPPLNVSLERSEGSVSDDTEEETGDELDINMEDMDTPDEADSVDFDAQGESDEAAAASDPCTQPEQSESSQRESKLWRSVVIGEQEHRIDMKCIEPYKRVISHGGYYEEQHAIIVFAACFLPDSDCDNYNYVMENLFLYVISTLELMVAEDYMIVYLNGATPRRRMPGFTWMKKCYQMIDRRLKKNLKMFIIVHPSWFIRTLLGITRPFISSKFSSKIKYVHSLRELGQIIPMEYVHIPPSIIRFDEDRHSSRLDAELQETTCKSDRKRSSAV